MPRNTLEIGSEPFPGYRLKELRGRGGFAEVWEARDPSGRAIALKFFTSNKTTTTVREVKSLTAIQKLVHPHLLRMHQVWSVPGYIVVAMELADGSLLELLDAWQAEYHRPIDRALVCEHLTQAAEVIDFLNQHQHLLDGRKVGWQHCDIKPSNLLIVDGQIKLADFGFSTAVTNYLNPYSASGTLDFAAPEIHRGVLSDTSDQYSLAVTYYYLRTGKFPFPPPPNRFARDYSYTRPDPDLSLAPTNERKVLERALSVDPEQRWPNCLTMLRALAEGLPGDRNGTKAHTPLLANSELF